MQVTSYQIFITQAPVAVAMENAALEDIAMVYRGYNHKN
jgi:hypothetical protein